MLSWLQKSGRFGLHWFQPLCTKWASPAPLFEKNSAKIILANTWLLVYTLVLKPTSLDCTKSLYFCKEFCKRFLLDLCKYFDGRLSVPQLHDHLNPFRQTRYWPALLALLGGEFSFFLQVINLIYKKMLSSSGHAKQSCKERIYQTSTGPVKTLIT